MLSMRGNTQVVAGTSGSGTCQGGPGAGGAGALDGDGPGRGGDDGMIALSSNALISKLNGVTGANLTSKDVCVVSKLDVVWGEKDVVRPVVGPYLRGNYRDRHGEGTDVVCGVVHDNGRPGGGEESSPSTNPPISKPNKVGGGLQGRIQFWEMKTGNTVNENQGEILPEYNTDCDSRGKIRRPKQEGEN